MASIRSRIGENMAESDKLIINEAEAIECLKINKPTSGYMMLQESVDMAIQALEKQIPKKRDSYSCPVCSHYFEDGECFTYCPECGQRLE